MSVQKKYQQTHVKRIIDTSVPSNITLDQLVTKLSVIKGKLDASKNQLDEFYAYQHGTPDQKSWERLQRTVDIYKGVRWNIVKQFNGQFVSNAWAKFYEMFVEYKLFTQGRNYRVFCNAELPGSSLCALNHYMATHNIKYEWNASSYFPEISTDTNVNVNSSATKTPLGDDYGLYKKYPGNWTMTPENTGDMTDIKCVLDLEKRFGPSETNPGYDFYSSDAGIDASKDANGNIAFNEQEALNAKLHLGCGLAGLLLLARGGSMILKQYTCFNKITIRLLIEYSKCFKTAYLCKPKTSRPYNSEIYFVGVGFIGVNPDTKSMLIDLLTDFETKSGSNESVEGAVDAIYSFSRYVFDQQREFIDENVKLMNKYRYKLDVLEKQISSLKKEKIAQWFKDYKVLPIDSANWL